MCVYVCVSMCVYVCERVCMSVCVYECVCMSVCMSACAHVNTKLLSICSHLRFKQHARGVVDEGKTLRAE
jgi:hypothetical protein